MNPFDKQTDLLTRLAQLMVDQVDEPFDALVCEYECLERYGTISSSLKLVKDGAETYPDTSPGFAMENLEVCQELRSAMIAHTGGKWTSFTLTLDADLKAHTKFHY